MLEREIYKRVINNTPSMKRPFFLSWITPLSVIPISTILSEPLTSLSKFINLHPSTTSKPPLPPTSNPPPLLKVPVWPGDLVPSHHTPLSTMGAFLDRPITTKETTHGEGNGLRYGVSSMQGWRMSMEDAHTTVPVVPGMDKCSFYAVFDGHCGPTIAKYSSENLLMEFLKHPDLSAFVNSGNNTNIDPEAVGKVM